MILKSVVEEDFVNYKLPSLFLAYPSCTFKCDRECGERVCQNSALAQSPNIVVDIDKLIERYLFNPITKAIVCGGLEPFDTFTDLQRLVSAFRNKTDDPIIIYTGYNRSERRTEVDILSQYPNIIIKFGRFIPNQPHHIDPILQVQLASPNQYAERIS
jgi:hypothetical protein